MCVCVCVCVCRLVGGVCVCVCVCVCVARWVRCARAYVCKPIFYFLFMFLLIPASFFLSLLCRIVPFITSLLPSLGYVLAHA